MDRCAILHRTAVAGEGAGSFSGGCHLNYPDNTPMANLFHVAAFPAA